MCLVGHGRTVCRSVAVRAKIDPVEPTLRLDPAGIGPRRPVGPYPADWTDRQHLLSVPSLR